MIPKSIKSRFKAIVAELKYVIVFSCGCLFFIDALIRIYIDYIANPVLSKVSSNRLTDLLFFLAAGVLVYGFITKIKKGYYVQGSQAVLSSIIVLFYVFLRFIYLPENLYRSLETIRCVKYADILILYCLIPVVLKINALKKEQSGQNENTQQNTFSAVQPITKKSQDFLGRAAKAERVSNEIRSYKSSDSIAIGIVGEWGSGKTSFVNMVKESFEADDNKNSILIDFNPWLNISVGSIIEDYFKTVEKAVEAYSIDIAKDIRHYANKVLGIHKSSLTEALSRGSDLLLDRSLSERFDHLNKLLKMLNKRVYIFIDDFDRLQSDEIFETLKLIRNTAGFDSFTYIVAYDREYMIESLKKHGIPKPEAFSEKIFQIEVELLPASREQINNHLKKVLRKVFPSKEEQINDFFEARYKRFLALGILKHVTSPLQHIRDVDRFMNGFIADYKQVEEEVFFRDYFILKLIKFKYDTVYTLLFSYRDNFLVVEDSNSSQGGNPRYKMARVDTKDSGYGINYYDVFGGSVLENYLTTNFSYLPAKMQEISVLLNNLFFPEQKNDKLSIAYESNYGKYFKDELSKNNLSLKEFSEIMQGNFENIKEAISNWFAEGKVENAAFFLSENHVWELTGRDEYENYIRAMFFIGQLPRESLYGKGFFGFNLSKLGFTIDDAHGEIVSRYYADAEELKEFIESLFTQAPFPYTFESSLCYYLERNEYGYTGTSFNSERRRYYLADYFRRYSERIEIIDDHFWTLYHNCKVPSYNDIEGNRFINYVYTDEAKEVFKAFMLRNLDNVLTWFISENTDIGGSDGTVTGLSKQVTILFGSYENLLSFLKSEGFESKLLKPSVFLNEFISYLELIIEKNIMVAYNFTYPPAIEKVNFIKARNKSN